MKKIFIQNLTNWKLPDSSKRIKENILKVINSVSEISSYELNLFIVSDSEIRIYNKEKRGKDNPTDVLSFPISDKIPVPHRILGEIFISYETLIRQAKELEYSEKEEFYRLLIHGILHLLGFDHERSKKDEKIMQALEDKCWKLIFMS